MAPILKEFEAPAGAPSTSVPAAPKAQPVALEIPVTVNGARTVDGSDKRVPFSESTQTVLVLPHGTVIRTNTPLASGQLVFLTNEKTKKEVVCQVVKSKNYRSVSGYVELEFTESVVGFWGMRFPSDRIATPAPTVPPVSSIPAAQGMPASPASPVAVLPKPAAPVINAAPRIPEIKALPVPPRVHAEVRPAAIPPPPAPPVVTAVPAPVAKLPEPPALQAATLASSLASLLDAPSAPAPKPPLAVAIPEHKPAAPAASSESEELRLQAARLQEQLSSLLFSAAPTPAAVPAAPVRPAQNAKPVSDAAAQLLDIAKSEAVAAPPAPPAAAPVSPVKLAPPPVKSSLDAEEVQIPSWLEPLARHAAAPASTQELIEREKAKRAEELAATGDRPEEPTAISDVVTENLPELPAFGSLLQLDEDPAKQEGSSEGSNKIFMIALVAAVILAVAGGGWYLFQPAKSASGQSPLATHAATVPAQTASEPPAPVAAQPDPQLPLKNSAPVSGPISTPNTSQPAMIVPASKPPVSSQPVPVSHDTTSHTAATVTPLPAAEKERVARQADPQPEPEQPKKHTIGEVHLASPNLNRPAASQDEAQAPTLATGADVPNVGGLDAGLAASSNKPAVPLPVGGDVKVARLISKVDPVYPAIAKSQHIAGTVVIDALIDLNGTVSTMKVISGPALLHQAAMDALRQWKYQPATLDGNPVPMHLNVSLQFHIQ
jgi:TonB family protein